MAWNPTPEVAALRDFGAKFDRPVVVTFALHPNGDEFSIISYGKTRKLCKLAASFGKQIADAINAGHIAPPPAEPSGEPEHHATWVRKDGGA